MPDRLLSRSSEAPGVTVSSKQVPVAVVEGDLALDVTAGPKHH